MGLRLNLLRSLGRVTGPYGNPGTTFIYPLGAMAFLRVSCYQFPTLSQGLPSLDSIFIPPVKGIRLISGEVVIKGKLARPEDPFFAAYSKADSYSFTLNQGISRGRGKQAKLAPDRRGKSLVTEVDYRTGVGKNLAKGSISDSSPTVN
ncbi:UNVERIFIED_CONTAM: putative mitochondrial protein [Sesamum calycinum]|uniref:Mitochondrial protein n=1 Tax=Sesamum calycinum TaxID=2727403 RepID=A0AAW2K0J6_9LAMI